MKRLGVIVGLTLLGLGFLGVSSAATGRLLAGDLDPSFGSGGVVNAPAEGIALQPDGKIVVLTSGLGSVARYLPDGSPDSSFGNGGSAATGFYAYAVAVQPDGKIVVAGATGPAYAAGSEFEVARYNPDGSPDTSFGANGIRTTDIPEPPGDCPSGSSTFADTLAVLPSGDILAAGTATENSCDPGVRGSLFALVRYTPDGSLDPAFGDGGIVQTDFSRQYGNAGSESDLAGIAVQPDGKIVASGSSGFALGGEDAQTMVLTRYNSDGSPDTSFGLLMTNPSRHNQGGPPILQDERILVAGATAKGENGPWYPVVARYFADGGGPDITKIRRGVFQPTGAPAAALAQPDGKILIVESAGYQQGGVLVRLLPNGRVDPSFGAGGVVAFNEDVSAVALQPDGEILVGGETLARLIGGNNCVVPKLRGKTLPKARASLAKSYCGRGRISRRFSGRIARGRVISSEPSVGSCLPAGAKVRLVVSKGPRPTA